MSSDPRRRVLPDEAPTQTDGPKGYYRQDPHYDPFNPGTGEDQAVHHGSRRRSRKSRKTWRSMKPRPTPGQTEPLVSHAVWFALGGVVLGFVLGFIARPLFDPGARMGSAAVPEQRVNPPKPDLERMARDTEATIRSASRAMDAQSMRPLLSPEPQDPLQVPPVADGSAGPPPSVEDSLLKLQPPPPGSP